MTRYVTVEGDALAEYPAAFNIFLICLVVIIISRCFGWDGLRISLNGFFSIQRQFLRAVSRTDPRRDISRMTDEDLTVLSLSSRHLAKSSGSISYSFLSKGKLWRTVSKDFSLMVSHRAPL